ncbi:TonB-dependent receptor [Empedobacter falsenii]|nr:TonB-dependent receptor [Empedobacter falsenii]
MKLLLVGAFALTATLSFAQVVEPTDSTKVVQQEDENVSLVETLIIGKGVIDLAEDRKTPVASTTITKEQIERSTGGGDDITKAFVNTPSVYVAGQSGGFGDSRVVTRGFDQSNTAFLLNGQPINDMESGRVYWSNWSGMSDIASAIQIQRGLGSSKIAISSVGGTYNFITKATEKKEGGVFRAGIANDYYYTSTLAYNTGLINNKFGVSLLLSHWQGNGYNKGTKGQGQNYFISFGYKPSKNHTLNFLLTGAPQWHDQNYAQPISTLLKYGRKFNGNQGYLHGELFNERRNFYHKPVMNINWDFDINDKTSLSTVLYGSWGRGGGTGPLGRATTDSDTGLKLIQNQFDRQSQAGGASSYAIRSNVNNHQWYGMLSNLKHKFTDKLNLNVGFDLRAYEGDHFQQLANLMGGDYYTVRSGTNVRYPNGYNVSKTFSTKNPWKLNNYAKNDTEKTSYDDRERVNYGGLFTQLEYSTDAFSTFFQGSVSNQTNQRWDYFKYTEENEKSEKLSNWGYNLKGGVSFTIAENHMIFANSGFYSRQPFSRALFLRNSNEANNNTKNEEVLGIEFGYKFKARNFWANLNGYYTNWKNRVTTDSRTATSTDISKYGVESGSIINLVNQGVEQRHKGLELEMGYKLMRVLELTGFASLGDWKYRGQSTTFVYGDNQNYLDTTSENLDKLKVGDAAQTQFGLGMNYKVIKSISVNANYRYQGDLYSSRVSSVVDDTSTRGSGNLKLPSYNLMDAGISWEHKLTDRNKLTLRFNVNNVFNHIYISESRTNYQEDYRGAETYKGLNVNNEIYFGYGRTWNATIKITI